MAFPYPRDDNQLINTLLLRKIEKFLVSIYAVVPSDSSKAAKTGKIIGVQAERRAQPRRRFGLRTSQLVAICGHSFPKVL